MCSSTVNREAGVTDIHGTMVVAAGGLNSNCVESQLVLVS